MLATSAMNIAQNKQYMINYNLPLVATAYFRLKPLTAGRRVTIHPNRKCVRQSSMFIPHVILPLPP